MKTKRKKIIGKNYLRCHPDMEEELGVPKGHVIVKQKDFASVIQEYTEMSDRIMTLKAEVMAIGHFIDMVEKMREPQWQHFKASKIAEPEEKEHLRQLALSRSAYVDNYIKNLRKDQCDERKVGTYGDS